MNILYNVVELLPVSVCIINNKKSETFVSIEARHADVSSGALGLFNLLGNHSRKVGGLKPGQSKEEHQKKKKASGSSSLSLQ